MEKFTLTTRMVTRRLPVIDDFTEEQLEKGDTSWTENYLSIENIKQIQHHTIYKKYLVYSKFNQDEPVYFASTARGMEDNAQCLAEEVSQYMNGMHRPSSCQS